MMDAIETREIGDYRIKIFYDEYPTCPCQDWDMAACYLWEYDNFNGLSVDCNWEDIYGKCADNKHSLQDAVRKLISKHVDFEELFNYFKQEKVAGYRLRHEEDMWYLEKYNYSRDERYAGYQYLFYFYDSDLSEGYEMTDEFTEVLDYEELIQVLNDLGKDIFIKEWSSRGYSQGDYVEGLAYCTKERYSKMVSSDTTDWKEKIDSLIDMEVNTIGMWMWGDVKGYVLEQRFTFTKVYDDDNREDEVDCEWEYVHDCWGYYMTTEELIEEVILEHDIKE